MSVFKNQTFGNSEDVTIVEFGDGDIAITGGYDKVKKIVAIALSNIEPHVIGEKLECDKFKLLNELDAIQLLIGFKKVESLIAFQKIINELIEKME